MFGCFKIWGAVAGEAKGTTAFYCLIFILLKRIFLCRLFESVTILLLGFFFVVVVVFFFIASVLSSGFAATRHVGF